MKSRGASVTRQEEGDVPPPQDLHRVRGQSLIGHSLPHSTCPPSSALPSLFSVSHVFLLFPFVSVLFSLFTPHPMSPALPPLLGSFIVPLPSLPPSLPQLLSLFCSPSSFVCLQSSSSSFQYPNPTFMHFVSFLSSLPFSRPYRPWLPLPLWVSLTVSLLSLSSQFYPSSPVILPKFLLAFPLSITSSSPSHSLLRTS